MGMNDFGVHEQCGVFGIYGNGVMRPANAAYCALFALQHRGQESSGIAVSNMGVIDCYKDMGLVGEVFDDDTLESLEGQIAIGHVRYPTAGTLSVENSLPFVMRYAKGRLAISLNGCLLNATEIYDELSMSGAMFQTSSDAEIIAHIIAKERQNAQSVEDAVAKAMKKLKGSYAMVLMSPRKLIAARDPWGFKPLAIGVLENPDTGEKSYVLSSETCAFDAIGASFFRDVNPGEVIVIDVDGLHSLTENCTDKKHLCIFEYIYFARPDSIVDGVEVHAARIKAGELLAKYSGVEADLVIGVPDSGLDAAIGFARESGIPYGVGFVRNNYVGRTFIKPQQSQRRKSVDIKLNVISQSVMGKRIVMVDDSIVRGSTTVNIIKMLKRAGAKEVHVRIASPTIHFPCRYGTDFPTCEELIANSYSVDGICELIGADSLGFLDKNRLCELVGSDKRIFCDACFTGEYPV